MIDEGYIKYRQHFIKDEPLSQVLISEINEYRSRLYEMKLIGAYDEVIGYGNISVKLPDGRILISGTQTGQIKHLGPQHYTVVESYNIDKNELTCKGPVKASSEALTHAAVYELDDSIKAVIHIHSRELWDKHINKMPTTRREVTYGTPEMAYEVRRLFEDELMRGTPVLVMAGHDEGIVTYGGSLDAAFQLVEAL